MVLSAGDGGGRETTKKQNPKLKPRESRRISLPVIAVISSNRKNRKVF